MKIALVHDYLSQDGGAEQVLRAFHEVYPDAPIFVLFHDQKKISEFSSLDVRESFFRFLPFGKTKYQWYLPLMPLATERHNLHEFDVVLSSTSAFAKGVLTRPETLHISYCHTPTRYLWTDTHEYIADLKYSWFVKMLLPRLIHKMRLWDKMSVDRVDYFIANSRTVAQRIAKYYRKESDVIYPPVTLPPWVPKETSGDYFISGGRLVPYKRFDILVSAFNRSGLPLVIFGDGPELKRLKEAARANITFVGRVSDEEKFLLLRNARAFIHPQVEDLGITPLESMAVGTPVLAYGVGGVTETVIPGVTGEFFMEQSWEAVFDVVLQFDPKKYDADVIRARAEQFAIERFKQRIAQYVSDRYDEFTQGLQQCKIDLW
jgi:glycosyltransferase involved in cell wall biosynthesis